MGRMLTYQKSAVARLAAHNDSLSIGPPRDSPPGSRAKRIDLARSSCHVLSLCLCTLNLKSLERRRGGWPAEGNHSNSMTLSQIDERLALTEKRRQEPTD